MQSKRLLVSAVAAIGLSIGAAQAAESAGKSSPANFDEWIEATGGGIIYEPNDGENLAKAITSLLNDPEQVRRLGARGRKAVIENYSISEMAKSMILVYDSLTDTANPNNS